MGTTPKGYTQIDNAGPMQGPQQINDAELFVENLIGENVTTVAALPASGNWPGRTISVGDPVTSIYVWATTGWVRTWSVGTPYATASGRGTRVFDAAASGAFVINYPAGRFTVPPIIHVDCDNPSLGAYFAATSPDATQATVQGFNGGAGVSVAYQWTAVQMTPTTAAG